MTYALRHGMGAIPSGWDTWPLPARVIDIRVRAFAVQNLATALGAEIGRANPDFRAESYTTVMGILGALARGAVQSSAPVQAVQNAVLYGLAQMHRLAAAALFAADSILTDKSNPSSAVKSDDSVARLRLALQALNIAEQIQYAVLRILSALRSATGTSGFGDLEAAAYTMTMGLLFGIVTGGATIPIAALVALVQLFTEADGITGAISRLVSRAMDTVGDAVDKVASGAAKGVTNWLTVVLIGGTILGGGYLAWNAWLAKRAAGRVP